MQSQQSEWLILLNMRVVPHMQAVSATQSCTAWQWSQQANFGAYFASASAWAAGICWVRTHGGGFAASA